MDYKTSVIAAANAAGLGYYGANAVGPEMPTLYNFEPNKFGIPVARFGDTPDSQDWRFIPAELVTELQYVPAQNAIGYIREFAGNEYIIKTGRWALLPDQYAAQLAKSDWNGQVDYTKLNNPALGYLLTNAEIQVAYRMGADPVRPEASISTARPWRQVTDGIEYATFDNPWAHLPWLENHGSIANVANVPIRRITPAIQAWIESKIQAYTKAQETFLGNNLYAPLTASYLEPYRNAQWIAVDPNDASNLYIGKLAADGLVDWWQFGPSLTAAGLGHLGGTLTAIQQNNAAIAGGDFFDSLVSAVVGIGIGSTLPGLGDLLSAATETAATTETAAMGEWLGTDIAVDVSASDSLASAVDISSPAANVTANAATETATGATQMDEFGIDMMDWSGTDVSADPFATTDSVNAGWNQSTGYGVDNGYGKTATGSTVSGTSNGITAAQNGGYAALDTSVNDIFSTVRNAVQTAGKLLNQGSAAIANAQRNLNQPQPNYTAAAGSLNLGLLAAAVIAWKLM